MSLDGRRTGAILVAGLVMALVAVVPGGAKIVRGTATGDRLVGTAGADRLAGRGGSDALNGRRGADSLVGGAGNDTIRGGKGFDRILGGKGRDVIYARDHHRDLIDCGPGKEVVYVDFV